LWQAAVLGHVELLSKLLRSENAPFLCRRLISKSVIESAVLALSVVTTLDIFVVAILRLVHVALQRRLGMNVNLTSNGDAGRVYEMKKDTEHVHLQSEKQGSSVVLSMIQLPSHVKRPEALSEGEAQSSAPLVDS